MEILRSNKILESLWVLILLLSRQICFSIFESKHVQNLISIKSTREYKYYATSQLIDNLCAINDDDEFPIPFKCIYPGESELKLEHSGRHATFLDLDIKTGDEMFFYFDKRDNFPFFIIRMPHFESKIQSTIFYGSIFSEFLCVTKSTMKLEHFLPRASELY